MALVIEDGTAKVDSQSFATVTEFRAYAAQRGATIPAVGVAGDKACEVLLIKAADYLQSINDYLGDQRTATQSLKWPRINVIIEWWPLAGTEIPRQLIQAQCALAIEAQTIDLLPTLPVGGRGAVIAESVAGVVSRAYANDGQVRNVPAIAKARALLSVLRRRSGLIAVRA